MAGSKEAAKSREWKPWSEADSGLFFDALKSAGKDFEVGDSD